MNIASEKIKVFPFGKYRDITNVDTTASNRLLYEFNIANILGKLIDTEGFVVGSINTDGTTDGELIINIAGYYFIIDSGVSLVEDLTGSEVYASIKITTSGIPSLDGQDSNNVFEGLNLTNTDPTDASYSICLMTKENSNWVLNPNVLKKFNAPSINITEIDGKRP